MYNQLKKEICNRPVGEGIMMIDVMGLSAPLSSALMHMVRGRAMTLNELAAELTLSVEETGDLAKQMIDRGMLTATEEADGRLLYRVRLISGRAHKSAAKLLESLEDG